MNNVTKTPLTMPEPSTRKTEMLNIRLTPRERLAIETLADRFDVSMSQLVRHFLIQIAAFYSKKDAGHVSHQDSQKPTIH